MARNLITTLTSTVVSKFALSASKIVLDNRRCSISRKLVKALVYLKDWMDTASRMQNVSLEDNLD